MKLTPAKCPSCGANIEVNDKLEKTICQYCGTQVLIEEAITKYQLEISGKVEVDGITSNKELLNRVRKYIKLKEYDEARYIIDKIVGENSLNVEAYLESIRLNLAILEENGFDGSKSRHNDIDNWYYVDNLFYDVDRVEKIDEDGLLKEELKKLQPQIDKIKDIVKKHEDDKDKYSECVNRLNDLFKKKEYAKEASNIFKEVFKINYKFDVLAVGNIYSNGQIDFKDFLSSSYLGDMTTCKMGIGNVTPDIVNKLIDECNDRLNKFIEGGNKQDTNENINNCKDDKNERKKIFGWLKKHF